jgi:hypothetical protein
MIENLVEALGVIGAVILFTEWKYRSIIRCIDTHRDHIHERLLRVEKKLGL